MLLSCHDKLYVPLLLSFEHSHSNSNLSCSAPLYRHALRTHGRALEAPLPPGATLDAWRVVVLVPASAEPAWSRPALEVALQKVVQPMAVEWHAGESGATLAAYLGVESLPGAVLIQPFCRQAQCEVRWRIERSPMWTATKSNIGTR